MKHTEKKSFVFCFLPTFATSKAVLAKAPTARSRELIMKYTWNF